MNDRLNRTEKSVSKKSELHNENGHDNRSGAEVHGSGAATADEQSFALTVLAQMPSEFGLPMQKLNIKFHILPALTPEEGQRVVRKAFQELVTKLMDWHEPHFFKPKQRVTETHQVDPTQTDRGHE